MASVFLTGGSGFLGGHLAETLVAAGHRVTASVRRTSDTRRLDRLELRKTELDLGVEGGPGAAAALAGCAAVVHCGALTRARNESEFMAVNAVGTRRLADAAAEAGVRRFVFISSLAARGPDGAAGPVSPYGRSKAEAEAALASVPGSMEVAVLRPGGVYGPRDADLLPLFRLAARGWTVIPRSHAPLQPVYVADVVSAVLAALDAEPAPLPLPIAGAERHSWGALARALMAAVDRPGRVLRLPPALFLAAGALSEPAARLTGKAPAFDRRQARDLSVYAWTCDIESSRRVLDPWRPRVGIEDGLARTAEWYRRKGWL
ncbi:MAG: NAD-dependent epimerase/dehydratase family protein [Gemmatimonadota bacterium]|uniref:NAD-dependent epimerase/dehydratase family protein n=1 Tax=Candidatus Palauibacter scopulicola TaxID=3056741 RepID=UPI00239B8F9C|nr:NAD-dependent epimerase/dehydratase family protein [Candidatus Palauibacter scopulicola]MDE2662744.1 NAD-dependent epimerase/dehydratase family protein [Candidatus Palauibacter scopulicola]